MNNKINPPIKIISLLLATLLLFSFNTNHVSAASINMTACTSWDLASDFRISPNQENPNRDSCNNPGVWEFMGSSGLTRNPQNYYTLAQFTPNSSGISGLNVWGGNRGDGLSLLAYNASGATQVFGAIVWPANTIDVHPAPDQLAIIAWHSPINGYVSITGGVSDNDPGGGDGIQWFIDKNTTNLALGSYNNGGSQTFNNGTNGANLNAVAVSTGDVLYIVVHPNGDYTYDHTRVDLSVNATSAPPPSPTPTSTSTPWGCTNWNLENDFRVYPNQENPNRDSCNNLGVWEFMGSTGLTRNPQNYYTLALAQFTSNSNGISGLNVWGGNRGDRLALLGYNASGATQTIGTVTWPANTIDVHPAPDQLAIIAWHSPVNGYVSISGGVSDLDPIGGNGIQWFIDKNSTSLASGSYGGGGSQVFVNGTNGAGLNTVSVSTGDVIYVVIDPNNNHEYDSTRVDLLISVTTPPTPTFTPTLTPTNTPTLTPTATFTLTSTPTFTPTNTPPPNHGGSGTCWASESSWEGYTVSYTIDRNTIPTSFGWDTLIHAAAQTWNNVSPSHFEFTYSTNSSNIISYQEPPNPEFVAQVYPHHLTSLFNITEKQMDLNPNYSWDTNNTPIQGNSDSNGSTTTVNVQNVMTHEFGHWLQLEDIDDPSCISVTMWEGTWYGDISKITLASSDEEAINWQYP